MKRLALAFALAFALALASCTKEESEIGLGLQDPATLYNGQCDTLVCTLCTVPDDSLNTTNYTQGLLGRCFDPLFGSAEAIVFAQLANAADGGLYFNGSVIDSVVLSLAIENPLYESQPDADEHEAGFEVVRLAEPMLDGKEHTYYAFDSLAVDPAEVLFSGTVLVHKADTAIRLRLNTKIHSLIEGHDFATNQELLDALRGVRIRLVGADRAMFTLNFNAAQSGLFIYRSFDGEPVAEPDVLSIGTGGTHFNRFILSHSCALAQLASLDSLDGRRRLYLEPMGGTRLRLNLHGSIQAFKAAHPNAVVHYAELQLPLAEESSEFHPESLQLLKVVNDTITALIPDMLDLATAGTLNYRYQKAHNGYHLRMTQHLQRLLREGQDLGTYVLINSRRSSAARAIFNGTDEVNPARVIIVYTEL